MSCYGDPFRQCSGGVALVLREAMNKFMPTISATLPFTWAMGDIMAGLDNQHTHIHTYILTHGQFKFSTQLKSFDLLTGR
jgi:hypothetical protein